MQTTVQVIFLFWINKYVTLVLIKHYNQVISGFYSILKSLEELAQQSKINYTVVEDSPYFEYFKNMAGAEEDLYK